MASNVTMTQMLPLVRQRANIENQTAFLPDTEIRDYINSGIQELYDLLVSARTQEFYRATNTQTTVTNQELYALPADFYQLISVDIIVGTNLFLTARPFMEEERNRFRWYPGWFYNMPVYYRLLAGNIRFIPTPNGIYQFTLNYYPVFTKYALNGATDAVAFDGVNGWEQYAIWRAVADCKAKGEEDPSYAMGQCMSIRQRIEALAAERDAGNCERVHDVTQDFEPWAGNF